MANELLKKTAKEKGVYLWEIAERFGLADNSFSRRLRHNLPEKETEKALRFIDEIAAEKRGE